MTAPFSFNSHIGISGKVTLAAPNTIKDIAYNILWGYRDFFEVNSGVPTTISVSTRPDYDMGQAIATTVAALHYAVLRSSDVSLQSVLNGNLSWHYESIGKSISIPDWILIDEAQYGDVLFDILMDEVEAVLKKAANAAEINVNIDAIYRWKNEAEDGLRRLNFVDPKTLFIDKVEWTQRIERVKKSVETLISVLEAAKPLKERLAYLSQRAVEEYKKGLANFESNKANWMKQGGYQLQEVLDLIEQKRNTAKEELDNFNLQWQEAVAAIEEIRKLTPPVEAKAK